jgi:hypothetical protein
VWDIAFDSRLRGKGGSRHDERILVTIRNDSDADGVAESGDALVAGANVTVEVRNSSGSLIGTLSGVTDAAGLFTSSYLTDLPDDSYTAEVVALSHATFIWNGALDPTVNDGDADGDGLPDEQHTIGAAAANSFVATTSESASLLEEDNTAAEEAARLIAAALSDPAVTDPVDDSTTETLATAPLETTGSGDETDYDAVYAEFGTLLEDELAASLLV